MAKHFEIVGTGVHADRTHAAFNPKPKTCSSKKPDLEFIADAILFLIKNRGLIVFLLIGLHLAIALTLAYWLNYLG